MQQSRDDQSRVLGTSMVVEGIFLFITHVSECAERFRLQLYS